MLFYAFLRTLHGKEGRAFVCARSKGKIRGRRSGGGPPHLPNGNIHGRLSKSDEEQQDGYLTRGIPGISMERQIGS